AALPVPDPGPVVVVDGGEPAYMGVDHAGAVRDALFGVLEVDEEDAGGLDGFVPERVDALGGADANLLEDEALPGAFGCDDDHPPVLAEEAGDDPRGALVVGLVEEVSEPVQV